MKIDPRSKAFKYIAGIAGIVALVWLVDLGSLRDAFSAIGIGDIFVLAILSFCLIAVSVLKWRLFLAKLGIHAGFWRLFALYLVGYFVNLLMPSYLGGDLVRSLYVGAKADRARKTKPSARTSPT